MIKSFQLNDKFALVAKTKSGKSYLGKILQRAFPRKIIIDTTYEYNENPEFIVYGFNEFCERVKLVGNNQNYTIVFRFRHEEKNQEEIFEEICRIVFYLQDTFFVVEEVHLHSTTHSLNHWLLRIATMGSHQGIGYLVTTQRPSLIHKTILTQCDHIFIGSLIDDNDINYVKNFAREQAKTLHTIEARKFIYWSHGQVSMVDTNKLK